MSTAAANRRPLPLSRYQAVLAIVVVLLWSCLSACAQSTQPSGKPLGNAPRPLRVLFVGNSKTFYGGGIPLYLYQLSLSGNVPLAVDMSVKGNATLKDLWNDGAPLAVITGQKWDIVVLQAHTDEPRDNCEEMFTYARKFDKIIHDSGAATLFYMTWVNEQRPEEQGITTRAYTEIGKELHAPVAPVGLAWRNFQHTYPGTGLYVGDHNHPNPIGLYLTACVFYSALFHRSPVGLTGRIVGAGGDLLLQLPPQTAAAIQTLAQRTVSDFNTPSSQSTPDPAVGDTPDSTDPTASAPSEAVPGMPQTIKNQYTEIDNDIGAQDVSSIAIYLAQDFLEVGLNGKALTRADKTKALSKLLTDADSVTSKTDVGDVTVDRTGAMVTVTQHLIRAVKNPHTLELEYSEVDTTERDFWVQAHTAWKLKRTKVLSKKHILNPPSPAAQ